MRVMDCVVAAALKLITFPTMRRSSISVRGRPPVLAKQSVVPGQLSTGTDGQFEAGVNTLNLLRERDTPREIQIGNKDSWLML